MLHDMRGPCPCPSLERCSQGLVEVFLEQRRPCAPSGSPLVERRMASVVLFQLSPATPPSAGDPLSPPPSLEKHLFSPTHPDPCLPLSPPAGDLLQLCYTLELLEFSASFPSPGNKRYLVESVSEYLALLRLVVNTRPSQALAALTKHLQTVISVYTECILEFQFYDAVGLQAFYTYLCGRLLKISESFSRSFINGTSGQDAQHCCCGSHKRSPASF